MTRTLIFRTLAALGLLLAVIAAVLALLIAAIHGQRDSTRLARRSQTVIATAYQAQKLMLDVQTALRGYLLAQDDRLLDPWRSARVQLPIQTRRLVALSAGDAALQQRARAIADDAASYVRDYADPLIARAQTRSVAAARRFGRANNGRQRVDTLRGEFAGLVRGATAISDARAASASADADRATWLAVGGLVACLLVLALCAVYVSRAVVLPVGALARAAQRVARGDLQVQVPVRRDDEVGRLASAFNAMSRSLEESRDELESQNAELEMQAIELEDRQIELTEANAEVRAQRDELELATVQLADEKRRVEQFAELADRLAAEREVERLAGIALATLARVAGADVGALYGVRRRDEPGWVRLALRGLDEGALPERMREGGEGLAARAVAEGGVVVAGHGDDGLRVRTVGGEAVVRHELHLGLRYGERAVGVVMLGRFSEWRFDESEQPALVRMAGQAAVALAEAGTLAEARWLAEVNRVVLDSVREGIVLIAPDGEVILSNASMEGIAREALGLAAAGELLRRAEEVAARTTDPVAYRETWAAIVSDPAEATFDEFEIAEPARVFERYSTPLDAPDGRRLGRVMVLRDVTSERQAERLKSDLMSTVSHELRTPLASVLGYVELLRTRTMDASMRDETLAVVHREAKRLSALIDDFLDLQSIEQDRLRLEREPFGLDEVLREQVHIFSGQSGAHRLELRLAGGPIVATGDRDRIAQVVANLLSNAIKYSPDGGAVRVEGARHDGDVLVAVADEGMGIPTADQPHVFERFFRVRRPEVRSIGGTGLGLALAHEIVAAHGGRMGFESVDGKGSRFWFTLPGV